MQMLNANQNTFFSPFQLDLGKITQIKKNLHVVTDYFYVSLIGFIDESK
jgi:hypothetical protein